MLDVLLLVGALELSAWEDVHEGRLVYVDTVWEGAGVCSDKAFGALPVGEGRISLGPHADSNHLVVDVWPGHPTRFPFNAVSCEYDPSAGPDMVRTRVRGFYTVLEVSIPTARQLELRPVLMMPGKAADVVRLAQRRRARDDRR